MAEEVKILVNTQAEGRGATQARKDIEDVGDAAERAGEKAKKASFDFKEFATNAGLGATAILGSVAAGIGFGAKVAGDLESARQGFVALLGSAQKADATMARVKREAAATPFEIPGLVAGTQALAAITKDGDKAIDILMNVGSAIATSGKGQAELDRVILNLQQIASTGKLTAMDIKQFQGAIPIFNDIVAGIGMTTAELQESENAADLLFLAFEKAAAQGGITAEGFSAQAGTFNQLVSNLKDNITILAADLVTQTGIFDGVKMAIGAINDVLTQATPAVIEFMKQLFGNPEAMIIITTIIGVLLVGAVVGLLVAMWPVIAATGVLIAVGAVLGLVMAKLGDIFDVVTKFVKEHWLMLITLVTFMTVMLIPTVLRYIASLVVLAVTKMATLIPAIVASILAFGAMVVSMLPLILIAGAIAAAVALLALAWKNNWLGMRDILKPIIESILKFLKPVIDFINKIIEGVKKLAGIGGSGIKAEVSTVGEVSTSVAGSPSIPNIPGLGTIPNFSALPNFAGGQNMSSVQNIQQFNTINTPVDMEAMMRNLQFAASTK